MYCRSVEWPPTDPRVVTQIESLADEAFASEQGMARDGTFMVVVDMVILQGIADGVSDEDLGVIDTTTLERPDGRRAYVFKDPTGRALGPD